MATRMKQPKYNFGLLETPASNLSQGSDLSTEISFQGRHTRGNTEPTGKKQKDQGSTRNIVRGSSSLTSSTLSSTTPSRARTPRSRKTPCTTSSVTSNNNTAVITVSSSLTSSTLSSTTPSRTRTPRSKKTPCITLSVASNNNTAVITAIVEGRGLAKGEIGMCSIDLKCPVISLSQFSDSQSYVKVMTKLQILQPIEIVIPSTYCNTSKLFKLIRDQYQNINISTVQRIYFNESKGLQMIKHLCLPEYITVEMYISRKYYCLATAAALLKYVEFIQNIIYAPSSLKVVFKGSENTTMIDVTTVKNLELVQNLWDAKNKHTLFGIMNYCKTSGGRRMMRANILQPPSDVETITLRQSVVCEFTENEGLFYGLQSVLKRFLDVDHLLSLCVQLPKQETMKTAESKITNLIHLKHVLEMVEPLQQTLKFSENILLKAYSKALEDQRFDVMKAKIDCIIHPDTKYLKGFLNMRAQKCFAVKANINGLLDIARRTYTEIIDDITVLVKQLSTKYQLPLKAGFNSTRGFFIQLHFGGKQKYTAEMLPEFFLKVIISKNSLSCTTPDLIKLNDRVKEAIQEIYLMTNIVVTELLNNMRDCISCLYKLSEIVSTLDMLLSFAHLCTVSDYVCPEFTDTTAIKQGRHPILEKIKRLNPPPIPNNTYASSDSNFIVITGPNMSGKSTYLRQVALLQIMAQIGSFVPATYASFRICDQIFSRIGSDDDLETNASTFTLEMREINYAIQNVSSNSLVIIDELGRGTSAEEGVGICYAVCEYLLNTKVMKSIEQINKSSKVTTSTFDSSSNHLQAITIFVTHFMELTTLSELYPNVENYHFEVQRFFSKEGNCEKFTYTHVLTQGKTSVKYYGIKLAEVSTLPRSVIANAKKFSPIIINKKQVDQSLQNECNKTRAIFKLATRLVQTARNSRLDNDSLKLYLTSLKNRYLEDLPSIRESEPQI